MPKCKAQSDRGSTGGVKKRRIDDGEGSHATISQNDGLEIVQQLKEKYYSATTMSERLSILTVLPKSWSLHKTANISGYMYFARRAKQLVAEKGVLSNRNPKAGKTLSAQTEEEVKNFYLADDISRVMPGKRTLFLW